MTSKRPSLAIAIEPETPTLPLFKKKTHNFQLPSSNSLPQSPAAPLMISKIPSFDDKFEKKPLSGFLKSKNKKCLCPEILIADDDPFQHIYYKAYFIGGSKEKYETALCFSGEELLEKYAQICQCPGKCGKLRLVIVDYQMGKKKLNGVEVSLKVREKGYSGGLILRSGETKEYLKVNHENFETIIQERTIDVFVSKDNIEEGQKIMSQYLTDGFSL